MSNQPPDHHCPACGQAQRSFARYPWYFCNQCLDLAEDAEGRRLVFGNASLSGGLSWGYADNPAKFDDAALDVICLISGRRVVVGEARFGGVVAQPLTENIRYWPDRSPNTIDLSRTHCLVEARKRLRERS